MTIPYEDFRTLFYECLNIRRSPEANQHPINPYLKNYYLLSLI